MDDIVCSFAHFHQSMLTFVGVQFSNEEHEKGNLLFLDLAEGGLFLNY